jgi:hypothetical protein
LGNVRAVFTKMARTASTCNKCSDFTEMKYGFYFTFNSQYFTDISVIRGYRGHDCMVVGFTTTYAIVVNSNPGQVSSY